MMNSRKTVFVLGCCVFVACLACGISRAQAPVKKPPVTVVAAERPKILEAFVSEFVMITPGQGIFPRTFRMGSADGPDSEQPLHEVTMTSPFAIGKYEVPQNLYVAVMGNNPSKWGGPRNSAEMFTYQDAVRFCERATDLLHEAKLIAPDEYIRLPTEAEWEYCCRAGTVHVYSFGDDATRDDDTNNKASVLDTYGWHTGNAAGNDPEVGALKPNRWGLYDMHGYLWEFTADAWHANYSGAPRDGSAWLSVDPQALRVLRGGSWQDPFPLLRSASRRSFNYDGKSDAVGMRCVKAKRT